ncbi:MAG: T9SS type A sorting domain-containing protein, partial [Bacteroidales bacterium]|nr:T9SS type A sorting domain-containing protein [Bacteroidales bacterium]
RGNNLEQEDSSPGEGLITFTGPVAQSASITATSPYRNGYLPRATEFDYGLDNPDLTIWASGRGWESSLYGGGGWNLLGNPFTSAMNARTFVTVNAGVFDPNYQAVYLYDGTANTYYYIANSTGWPSGDFMDRAHIQAGQGFWALAYYNNVDFSFTPGMQEHSNQVPMLKSAATDDRWPGIRLEVRSGGEEASTTLVFNEAMALGLDRGYDVGMLSAGSEIEIYTTLVEKDNGVNFARQALPTANADAIIVPIGIDTEKGGEVTFSAYTVPLGNNKFWLEDRTTGIITDLSASTYKVLLPAKTYGTGRFYLKATSSITDIETQAEEPGSGLRIWAYDGKVIIKGEVTGRAVCSVYDIRGKKITETHLDGGDMNTITIPAGSTGIYIIRVADGPRITTQKVVFP